MYSSMVAQGGLLGGGTITGSLTITGDLSVSGDITSVTNQTVSGTVVIDVDDAEALLIRKDGDGGDVFTVNTDSEVVTVGSYASSISTDGQRQFIVATNNNLSLTIGTRNSDAGALKFADENHSGPGAIEYNHSTNQMTFDVNQTEALRLTAATNQVLTSTLDAATGNEVALSLNYTVNKATSGNDTGLLINMTDTSSPGTSLPLDIQVGGSSVFSVDQMGRTGIGSNGAPSTSAVLQVKAQPNSFHESLLELDCATSGSNSEAMYLKCDGTWNSNLAGSQVGVSLEPTISQSSSAGYTIFQINLTETATGSGSKLLMDLQVGGSSKLKVDNAGVIERGAGTVLSMTGSSSTGVALTAGGNIFVHAESTGKVSLGAGGFSATGNTVIEITDNTITVSDGDDLVVGTTTGTKIGTATTQKLGFFNATPVVQQSHVADPSGGATQDAEARTAINSILSTLETLGFHATS